MKKIFKNIAISMTFLMAFQLISLPVGSKVSDIVGTTKAYSAGNTYYISPNGSDSNAGTSISDAYYSLAKAVSNATAGDTIYMTGGKYNYSSTIPLSQSGTEDSKISILAVDGEKPVLDFSTQPYASSNRAFLLTGNYWVMKGLEICYAGDNGMKLEGSYNSIENCVFHHNGDSGIQLGFAHTTENPDGLLCSYNEIINCDAYLNFDFDNAGSDADGFACKMHNGKGNRFVGCRAWRNGDDGWDLFETDWSVEIINCWTWHNADQADFKDIYLQKMGKNMSSYQGNGNGFKLGGNGTGGSSKGVHIVKNCVSFDNNFRSKKGFDQNSHKGGVQLYNCTSFGNGYNYMFEDAAPNEFYNNVSFACRGSLDHEIVGTQANNSWDLSVTANSDDFVSLAEELAKAPRNSDGSLPDNSFAKLISSSDLIDKGKDVGLLFNGSAPDLGAFEYGGVYVSPTPTIANVTISPTKTTTLTPTPSLLIGDVTGNGVVDSGDYLTMRRYLLHIIEVMPAQSWKKVGDVNLDGVIDSADYSILRMYLIGKINKLPNV